MATYHPQCILLALLVCAAFSPALGDTTSRFTRSETLSDYFSLTWEVDLEAGNITFEVKAKTTGYVGFGLNSKGGMKGADIVIGGVFANGTSYFSDRHGIGNEAPVTDNSQDWFLLSADEANGWTTLRFHRRFITCDQENDVPITKDTLSIIFAVGTKDKLGYHQMEYRGAKSLLLLNPPAPPVDLSAFEQWHIPVHTEVPAVDTTYWVTIHKSPKFNGKSHIVGYKPRLDSADALKYTHHLVFHRCRAREGVNLTQLLEPYVGHEGARSEDPRMLKIRPHCHTYLYAWAKGGDPLNLPDHVGIPIGETGQQEYFLLEVHYDNPNMDSGKQFETGITVYYTDKLRTHDAGVLFLGAVVTPGSIIPPNLPDFVHIGHCSSECTKTKMPAEGINVTSILLHAHLHARKERVRHWRNGVELPFLTSDENFDFDYQQDRLIKPERSIIPGDHLTVECHYNSQWRTPPSAAYGGESNHHEMCQAYLLYYPLMKHLDQCASTYTSLASRLNPLGIQKIDMKASTEYPIVTAPESMKGLTLMEALNTRVNWTSELIERLQYETRWADQKSICKNYRRPEEGLYKPTNYPNVTAYVPEFKCDQ